MVIYNGKHGRFCLHIILCILFFVYRLLYICEQSLTPSDVVSQYIAPSNTPKWYDLYMHTRPVNMNPLVLPMCVVPYVTYICIIFQEKDRQAKALQEKAATWQSGLSKDHRLSRYEHPHCDPSNVICTCAMMNVIDHGFAVFYIYITSQT